MEWMGCWMEDGGCSMEDGESARARKRGVRRKKSGHFLSLPYRSSSSTATKARRRSGSEAARVAASPLRAASAAAACVKVVIGFLEENEACFLPFILHFTSQNVLGLRLRRQRTKRLRARGAVVRECLIAAPGGGCAEGCPAARGMRRGGDSPAFNCSSFSRGFVTFIAAFSPSPTHLLTQGRHLRGRGRRPRGRNPPERGGPIVPDISGSTRAVWPGGFCHSARPRHRLFRSGVEDQRVRAAAVQVQWCAPQGKGGGAGRHTAAPEWVRRVAVFSSPGIHFSQPRPTLNPLLHQK